MNEETVSERIRLALARSDLLCEAIYINGKWHTGASTIAVTNSAIDRVLDYVPSLRAAEAKKAVAAARATQPVRGAMVGAMGSMSILNLRCFVPVCRADNKGSRAILAVRASVPGGDHMMQHNQG